MTPDEIDRMRREEPRTFDAAVAEHVHQWTKLHTRRAGEYVGVPPALSYTMPVSEYATDANADLDSLNLVRKSWDYDAFAAFGKAVRKLQHDRLAGFMGLRSWGAYFDGNRSELMYVVGDWSHAALLVALASPRPDAAGKGG